MVSDTTELPSLLNKNYFREATAAQVNGFPNRTQCGFKTYNQAWSAWLHSCSNHTVGPPSPTPMASKKRTCKIAPSTLDVSLFPFVSSPPPRDETLTQRCPAPSTFPAPPTLDISLFPSVSTPPPRDETLTRRHPAPHPRQTARCLSWEASIFIYLNIIHS